MLLSMVLCVLQGFLYGVVMARAAPLMGDGVGNANSGAELRERRFAPQSPKGFLLGKTITNFLIHNAKPVGRTGTNNFFKKRGGLKRALKEFSRCQPKDVQTQTLPGGKHIRKEGKVGDRDITLEGDNQSDSGNIIIQFNLFKIIINYFSD